MFVTLSKQSVQPTGWTFVFLYLFDCRTVCGCVVVHRDALVCSLAELLSPIKNACLVWVPCLCFAAAAPGPTGSSRVNKRKSFDKHASHPRAHALPGAP